MNEAANVLKKLKADRGLTNQQIGNAVGVTADTVQKWTSGANTPGLDTVSDLCRIFHINPCDFFPDVQIPLGTRIWKEVDSKMLADNIAGMSEHDDKEVIMLEKMMLQALIEYNAENTDDLTDCDLPGKWEYRNYSTYQNIIIHLNWFIEKEWELHRLWTEFARDITKTQTKGAWIALMLKNANKEKSKTAALKAINDIMSYTNGHLWIGSNRFAVYIKDDEYFLLVKNQYSDPEIYEKYLLKYDVKDVNKFWDGCYNKNWTFRDNVPYFNDGFRIDVKNLYKTTMQIMEKNIKDPSVLKDIKDNIYDVAYALRWPFDPQKAFYNDGYEPIIGKQPYGAGYIKRDKEPSLEDEIYLCERYLEDIEKHWLHNIEDENICELAAENIISNENKEKEFASCEIELLKAFALYIWHVYPKDKKSYEEMINLAKESVINENDMSCESPMDKKMMELEKEDPENKAVEHYKIAKMSPVVDFKRSLTALSKDVNEHIREMNRLKNKYSEEKKRNEARLRVYGSDER